MPGAAAVTGTQVGFDGKLPSRGDFVGRGLPRGFLTPWRSWVDAALIASREALGESWLPAWLEAPVWRFALPAHACGPAPVLGLMMPSVDRAGRHYPLSVASVFETVPAAAEASAPIDNVWLDAVEAVSRDALALDHDPDTLLAAIPAIPRMAGGFDGPALWWTAGSPRVPATRLALPGLPAPAAFAGMIDAAGAA